MNSASGDAGLERDALEALLRWYTAMGVDAAIDEAPHDRFVEPAQPRPQDRRSADPRSENPRAQDRGPVARTPTPPESRTAAPPPVEELQREADVRAARAEDIGTLRTAFEGLPGFGLASTARMIWAGGTPGAPLMVVCGAPDSDDEREGAILSGKGGLLFDAMMRAIGLGRDSLYIAPLVPWRPPGNRPPSPAELAVCLPFARRHITLARPRVILCLGERAAQPLLGSSEPISRLRGRWHTYEGEHDTVKLLATYSLPYLLSQPLQKRRAWTDLQMLIEGLRKTD